MRAIAVGTASLLVCMSQAVAQEAPRSAQSLECSKQADVQGVHGVERKAFMTQCKATAGPPAQQPNQQAVGPTTSMTTQECSAKYQEAKAAGTLNGKLWNDFRREECNAAGQLAPAIVFPKGISPVYSQEPEGKARMHTCLDQYNANKTTNASGGLKWIEEAGGGYYSVCNEKLKAPSASPSLPVRAPAVSQPAAEPPRLADGSPRGVIEAAWNNAIVNLTVGHVAVVTGVAGGNQEFTCGSGSIGPGALAFLKAAQTTGVVSLVEDTASQQYNQGQSFSWGQMLNQTTAGVNATITVTATALGQSLDITSQLPAAQRLRNCLRFRQGRFRITQIIKEQSQRVGVSDYRILFLKYKADWSPYYREMMRLTGTVLAEDRKATVLLKDDPFHGGLVLIASDLSDADKEFTTNNVNVALASGK